MSAEAFVTDTHPLVWYFCTDQRKLSRKVRKVFDDAIQRRKSAIYVPTVVLWEMSILLDDGVLRLNISFSEFIDKLFKHQLLVEQPFDCHVLKEYHGLRFTADPFDKAIVATALLLQMPLITADGVIQDAGPCEVYW